MGPHPKLANGRLPVVPTNTVKIESARLITRFDRSRAQQIADANRENINSMYKESIRTSDEKLGEVIASIEREAKAKFVTTKAGIMVLDRRVGTGPSPTLEDTVAIQYRGMLVNGTEFENKLGEQPPPTYRVGELIRGLQEALLTMNEGGERTVIVPPELAFGEGGVPGKIPPNATVIYDLELLDLQ